MDLAGLLNNILIGSSNIDIGRKYLATDGLEHAGRLSYEDGISLALSTFKDAQTSADTQTLIFVELTYLQQEFQSCNEDDVITRSSLTQAIQSFEDALRCLKVVEDSALYKAAEATYPTATKYRYHGYPCDAVHLACTAVNSFFANTVGIDVQGSRIIMLTGMLRFESSSPRITLYLCFFVLS